MVIVEYIKSCYLPRSNIITKISRPLKSIRQDKQDCHDLFSLGFLVSYPFVSLTRAHRAHRGENYKQLGWGRLNAPCKAGGPMNRDLRGVHSGGETSEFVFPPECLRVGNLSDPLVIHQISYNMFKFSEFSAVSVRDA
jgi:hypothetical protein